MSSNARHVVGLSLGGSLDFTALAVLQCGPMATVLGAGRRPRTYAVRYLERLGPGTPYADIGMHLGRLLAQPSLMGRTLVVDRTCVGRPVVELLRRCAARAQVLAAVITMGRHAAFDPSSGGWLVPRQELVATLQLLLQSRRLLLATALPEAASLAQELEHFQARPAAVGDEVAVSWRERPHDDLVLAVAVAAWDAERQTKGSIATRPMCGTVPSWPRSY